MCIHVLKDHKCVHLRSFSIKMCVSIKYTCTVIALCIFTGQGKLKDISDSSESWKKGQLGPDQRIGIQDRSQGKPLPVRKAVLCIRIRPDPKLS